MHGLCPLASPIRSVLGHRASVLQHCLNAFGHAWDERFCGRITPCNAEQLAAEHFGGAGHLLFFPQRLLCPTPNVLLRVEEKEEEKQEEEEDKDNDEQENEEEENKQEEY